MRVKPERRGVSYPASTGGPIAAPPSSLRRVTSDESSGRRLPRRTATLTTTQDVVRPTPIRPTPIGQVLILLYFLLHITTIILRLHFRRKRLLSLNPITIVLWPLSLNMFLCLK